MDSALAGILMGVNPLVTLLLAHRFAAGERMTPYLVAGFVVGFLGVVVLMSPAALSGLGGAPLTVIAQISVLCGSICYSANSVIARIKVRGDLMVTSAATVAIAALISVPVALTLDAPWRLDPDWNTTVVILWIGIGPTAIATFIYFALIRSAGPTFMSTMNYLVPCVALAAGVALLGEQPDVNAYLGLILILAGIGISQVRR
jgi:drug/metabolite transporter (DMT)-like permease